MRASTVWINMTSFVNAFTGDVPMRKVMKNFVAMWFSPEGHIKAAWENDLQQYRLKTGASFEAQIAMRDSPSSSATIQTLEAAGVIHRIVTNGDHARYELAEDLTEPFVLEEGHLAVPSVPGVGRTPRGELLAVRTTAARTLRAP